MKQEFEYLSAIHETLGPSFLYKNFLLEVSFLVKETHWTVQIQQNKLSI